MKPSAEEKQRQDELFWTHLILLLEHLLSRERLELEENVDGLRVVDGRELFLVAQILLQVVYVGLGVPGHVDLVGAERVRIRARSLVLVAGRVRVVIVVVVGAFRCDHAI